MKPNLETLLKELPGINEEIIKEHLDRLGDDYFKKFNDDDIVTHIELISKLSASNPVETRIVKTRDNTIECIVTAFDYPSEFSLISGLLSGTGLNILSGDVYTYGRKEQKVKASRGKRRKRVSISSEQSGRRKIVDFFSGELPVDIIFYFLHHARSEVCRRSSL